MKNRKTICNRILHPPVWLMIVLAVSCTALLIFVFVNGFGEHAASSVVYVAAFYTLTVIVLRCIEVFPTYYRNAKQRVYDHPVGGRFMTDMPFRTHVTLYCSLTVNLLYVALNLISGFLYHSAWFGILAGYYVILAVMRFLLVRFVNRIGIGKNRFRELRRSRLCGMILLTVNLVLSGAVLMMLYQNRGYEYHGILIYVMAAYTFYITVNAIVNLVKYRKLGSPVMSAAKVINMAAALVSMLSLETAMLAQFGSENSPQFRRIMIAATGGGVSVIVVTMSVYMIVKASMEIRKLKSEHKMEDSYGTSE